MRTVSRALVLALALALAIPAATFAATSVSTTTATATVDAALSMTGIPATLNFGHNVGGSTLTAPAFSVDVVSSEPSFAVTATATNFVSGANTIPMEKVSQSVNGVVFAWTGYTSGAQIPLGTVSPMSVALSLAVPSAAKTGVYTSTFTFTASN